MAEKAKAVAVEATAEPVLAEPALAELEGSAGA